MNPYTKRKFLSLTLAAQHKKSAELLRRFYVDDQSETADYYNEIQEWMSLPILEDRAPKSVSDRYHNHLREARVHLSEHALLPRARTGDRSNPSGQRIEIHLYLDQIRSAHNVGSILRTAEAFRLGDVYFSCDTPLPDHPQVSKTAMGCAESILFQQCASLSDLPRPLIALETSSEAIPLNEYIFPSSCCLALGNEEYGLSDEVLELADTIVEIPLYGKKNSLNVANAFAIAAAAASQQLRSKESHASV